MAWTAPRTWVTGEVVTAAIMNTHLRDNLLALLPSTAEVQTSETETATAYDDMTTAGPSVTVDTPTVATVIVSARISNSAAGSSFASYAVSGATTSAATDERAAHVAGTDVTVSTRVTRHTGLTAGSNTFTMKYRVASGTGTFVMRRIFVFPW